MVYVNEFWQRRKKGTEYDQHCCTELGSRVQSRKSLPFENIRGKAATHLVAPPDSGVPRTADLTAVARARAVGRRALHGSEVVDTLGNVTDRGVGGAQVTPDLTERVGGAAAERRLLVGAEVGGGLVDLSGVLRVVGIQVGHDLLDGAREGDVVVANLDVPLQISDVVAREGGLDVKRVLVSLVLCPGWIEGQMGEHTWFWVRPRVAPMMAVRRN